MGGVGIEFRCGCLGFCIEFLSVKCYVFNGLRLEYMAEFQHNMGIEYNLHFKHQIVLEAFHPPYCQTAVTGWRSVFRL
jgi:hypothetical protein